MRETSGAAIGVAEEANTIAQLFPKYGDDAGVLKQKAALREGIVGGMKLKLGTAAPLAEYASGSAPEGRRRRAGEDRCRNEGRAQGGRQDLQERQQAPLLDRLALGGRLMAWEATDETVATGGGGPGGWTEEQPTSWWERAKGVGQTVDDAVRAAANAATFGMADRLAGLTEGGTDAAVKRSEAARERSPIASIGGDVAGAVALPGLGGAGLATRLGAGAAGGRLSPALARAAGYGVEGAGIGAAQGAGTTYTGIPADYVKNALLGGAIGVVTGGIGGAAFGPRPMVSGARAPSADELEAAKTAAYRTLERHPAQYTPQSFAQRADDIEAALRARNAHETTSPQTFRTVEQMRAPPTATAAGRDYVSPADVDFIRKGVTGEQIAGVTPTDQAGARVVRRGIDDFVRNPPPGAAVPGTEHLAGHASRVADTAHQLHGGFKRTQALEELIDNAGRTAGATHSGLNLRNELQKAVRTGLKEKGGVSAFSRAGYNAAERAALDQFSRGQGRTSQVLGYLDKYLGGGGGLGALAAARSAASISPLTTAAPTACSPGSGTSGAGLALRTIGNRRAAANINELRNTIAQRNPLYAQRAANAPMVRGGGLSPGTTQTLRDAMTIELLNQQRRKKEDD